MKQLSNLSLIIMAFMVLACKDKRVIEPTDAPLQDPHFVGESYGGGKVIYADKYGQHGLISAMVECSPKSGSISIGAGWWNNNYVVTNATYSAIFLGSNNTNLIVLAQSPGLSNRGVYAARICDTISLGGYSDWYLPSKDELNLIFLYRYYISFNFTNTYWSSTEISGNAAWVQNFNTGTPYSELKNQPLFIIPVRKF